MKNLIPILLVAALCGCAFSPTTARKAPPLPPMPPGMKAAKIDRASSATLARASFIPAATAPVGYPAIFINGWYATPPDPPFPAQTNVFIACDQPSNNVLSVRMNSALGTSPINTWPEPAQWGCYPQDQLLGMSVNVPGTSFFKSILTPCAGAFAPASAETQTATAMTVVVRGRTYRVINLQRAGEDTRKIQRHRLVPIP